MSFTSEEITQAIEKLVRSSVRRPYDSLGVRRLDVPFSDTQEAAAGVFLLNPRAPFYVLSLGAAKLLRTLRLEVDLLEQVIDAIEARGRMAMPVTTISPLHNARAGLEELGHAVTSRAHGFTSVDKVPAYQRFKNNVDRFLADAGSNVKLNGDLVQTPQQAKKNLPTLLRELKNMHKEFLSKVILLRDGMDNYSKINLPSLVAQGVISRARDLLSSHTAELEKMTPDQRNETLRQVVIDLCASKAVVRRFGSLTAPSSTLSGNGVGSLYGDAEHPVEPASLVCPIPGPYSMINSNLQLYVDVPWPVGLGDPPTVNIDFANSFVAEVRGSIDEPYDIQAGVSDLIYINVHNVTSAGPTTGCSLTAGIQDADTVAADINAAVVGSGMNVKAEAFFNTLKFENNVNILSLGGNNARFTFLVGTTLSYNIKLGDIVFVPTSGYRYVVVSVGLTTIDTAGTGPAITQNNQLVQIGNQRRVRITSIDKSQSLGLVETILIPDDDLSRATNAVLGFFPNISSTSRPTSAKGAADNINRATALVSASALFTELYAGTVQTDPLRPLVLTIVNAISLPVFMNPYGLMVRVHDGPNIGDYYVMSMSGAEITLLDALPQPSINGQPVTFSFGIGTERVSITSKNTTISSYVQVNNVLSIGGPLAAGVVQGFLSTPWFVLESIPQALDEGDLLELYKTDYSMPDEVHEITSINKALNLIQVDPPITPGLLSYSFDEIVEVPFARLRAGKVIDWEGFKNKLATWCSSPPNANPFFIELTRLVNPLLANDHPTAAAVNDARNKAVELAAILTEAGATLGFVDPAFSIESILADYVVGPEPNVDTLIRTYQQQGADRAVDLLTEGQFAAFFSMSADGASYTGDLLNKMRGIAHQDLPVSKMQRPEASQSQSLGGVKDIDFEYDTSDTDTDVVDPPAT